MKDTPNFCEEIQNFLLPERVRKLRYLDVLDNFSSANSVTALASPGLSVAKKASLPSFIISNIFFS